MLYALLGIEIVQILYLWTYILNSFHCYIFFENYVNVVSKVVYKILDLCSD